MKFTEGPWSGPVNNADRFEIQGGGRRIAVVDKIEDACLMLAAPLMFEKLQKVVKWLEMLATNAEKRAEDKRFLSLSEANAADAKNWRATAKDINEILAKAVQHDE